MLPWPSIIKKLGNYLSGLPLGHFEWKARSSWLSCCWLKNGQAIGGERLTLLYVSFVRDIDALILIHGLIPSN